MEEDSKKAIIEAAFELLGEKDMNTISVREITNRAGVNVAAVSYYFGGKTELFAYMMELYWADLCELCREILNTEVMTKEKATEFCLRYIKKEMSSTGILRSEQIMYQNYEVDQKTQERIALQFQAFAYLIRECSPSLNETEVQLEIVSLLSSLTHPAFWNEIACSMVGELEPFMQQYVSRMVEQIYEKDRSKENK